MRRLCFGGTFDPIHHGHLLCARAVAEAAGYGGVTLIPSARPPHKPGACQVASPVHRLAMCRLAVQGDPLFDVDDLEIARAGPSYTIDTARQFKRQGWPAVDWLIGGDTVPHLPAWHEADALLREVNFIVMARPGETIDWASLGAPYRPLAANLVAAPLIQISATDLRRRVAAGRPVDYLTPPAVVDYIRRHGLYAYPHDVG